MPTDKPRKGATKKERQKVASKNISTFRREGMPEKQAIAAGLNTAGLSNKKKTSKKKVTKKKKSKSFHTFE